MRIAISMVYGELNCKTSGNGYNKSRENEKNFLAFFNISWYIIRGS